MNSHPPLTRIAQDRVAEVLHDGDLAVDATVGNGHDTLFLARQVGPTGRVWGFDVQADTLARVQTQLNQSDLAGRVQLLHTGHEHLATALPDDARGRLSAVMFNLGYLPGGDKQLTTRPDTTLQALAASVANLRPGGLLSVMVYRGHTGGQQEADAVADWLRGSDMLELETLASPGPVLYLAQRYRSQQQP